MTQPHALDQRMSIHELGRDDTRRRVRLAGKGRGDAMEKERMGRVCVSSAHRQGFRAYSQGAWLLHIFVAFLA